jgi:hypothetical protein
MAATKFTQMSTKKLTALLETASDEDKVAIQAILDARNAKNAETAVPSTELTSEEQAAIEAAENGTSAPAEEETKKEKKVREKAPKMSVEELEAKAAELKETALAHRCSFVISGTAFRVNGTITGVLVDKRASQVYLAINSDETDTVEAKKMYKKWNSADLEISDEVVNIAKSHKKSNATSRVRKEKLSEEEWFEMRNTIMELAGQNVGKTVVLDEDKTGHITGLINDKRSCNVYYRIEFLDELEMKKTAYRVVSVTTDENNKVTGLAPFPGMEDELDEEGQKIAQAFSERKVREPRKVLTPEEKVLAAEEAVKKAEAILAKAQEALQARKFALETAKKELEDKHNAQAENAKASDPEAPTDDLL